MKTSLCLALVLLSGCATKPVVRPKAKTAKASPQEVILDHGHFRISYNPRTRLANYVVYRLSGENLRAKVGKRKNKFMIDPLLKERSLPWVDPKEYARSGYDKGHLAPAADFAWDQGANDMTFVMSNMAPQKPRLNQRAWKYLEDRVRRWACGEGEVTVITGPILGDDELPPLKSGLEVPGRFFKTIIDETPPRKAISFVYYQTDSKDVFRERIVPLKDLEHASGVRFARLLEDPRVLDDRRPASVDTWKEADCH